MLEYFKSTFKWSLWIFGSFLALILLTWIFYPVVEETNFPKVDKKFALYEESLPKSNRSEQTAIKDVGNGALLIDATFNQLERELKSFYGWSVNDIYPATAFMDNRANRQKGIIFATRMLENFFATRLSKLGKADNENSNLKKIREELLVFSADKYGFLIFPSPEAKYREALKLKDAYKKELLEGKAVFNLKTNDLYDLLSFITSESFLDQANGEIKNKDIDFSQIDDKMYYVQGVILVLRDFVNALAKVDENSMLDKGAIENLLIAFDNMDEVCNFNPLIIAESKDDSMIPSHLSKVASIVDTIDKRLTDIMMSIKR